MLSLEVIPNLHYSYYSVTKKLNGSASAWAQRWRWRM